MEIIKFNFHSNNDRCSNPGPRHGIYLRIALHPPVHPPPESTPLPPHGPPMAGGVVVGDVANILFTLSNIIFHVHVSTTTLEFNCHGNEAESVAREFSLGD